MAPLRPIKLKMEVKQTGQSFNENNVAVKPTKPELALLAIANLFFKEEA